MERLRTPAGRSGYSALYHWRCVARWRGLTWEAFRRLHPDDQAGYIAEYETAIKLDALEQEAARKEAERKSRASAAARRSRGRRR